MSNFNTNKVTDMKYIFDGLPSLKKENIITEDKKLLSKLNI